MEGKICPPEGFIMEMMKDDLLRVRLMVGRRRHGGDLGFCFGRRVLPMRG